MAARRSRRFDLLPATVVTAAGTVVGNAVPTPEGLLYLALQATFAYGSGGTTCKAYVQTTVDGGVTWRDVACFAFATAAAKKTSALVATVALAPVIAPSDAALADDTILNGLLGDQWRVKVVSVGTYAGGTSIQVSAVSQP